jgi:hypothetical protein
MLTEKQLAEIEKLEQAATPGPWVTEWQWERLDPYVMEAWAETPRKSGETFDDVVPQVDADRLFIDRARTIVPALLRDIRRLRAVVEQYADHNNWTNVGALRDFQPSEVDIWTLSEPGYTRAAECLREDGE